MQVVQLGEYRLRDTLAVLRFMLRMATAGELAGMTICYRHKNGDECSVFTGEYRTRPAEGAAAALRLSMELARTQGEFRHPM